MSYNLDQSVNGSEYFEFTLGGNQYRFTYPTTEELQNLAGLVTEDGKPDLTAQSQSLNRFIAPVDPNAPGIEDALKHARVPAMKAFRNMVATEFGIEG